MMYRKPTNCAICESSNIASICTVCVNYRLNEYYTLLKELNIRRDQLCLRLSDQLVAKGKTEEQLNWKFHQNEKIAGLKEKLRKQREQLCIGRSKLKKMSNDLNVRYGSLDFSRNMLEKNRVEQLEKSYPNWICTHNLGHMAITSERLHRQSVVVKQICKLFSQRRVDKKDGFDSEYVLICNARLPQGLNPHSVPAEELSVSLGHMVHLLDLIVRSLGLPTLHNSGFAGSYSRIWQRSSYWDTRPSSRSDEYPLFIPQPNSCLSGGENSWSDNCSNGDVASVECVGKPRLDLSRGACFNYSRASPHSMETHSDVQNGINLLKKSVACITAYCYSSLCLDIPRNASTFEAFAKLLSILSSSKELRSVLSLKMACSRSCKQVQLNKSVCNVSSMIASSTVLESTYAQPIMRNMYDMKPRNSASSYVYAADVPNDGKNETFLEGWDLVEPTFPPPPSEVEDIEHWTRAMFTDATRRK